MQFAADGEGTGNGEEVASFFDSIVVVADTEVQVCGEVRADFVTDAKCCFVAFGTFLSVRAKFFAADGPGEGVRQFQIVFQRDSPEEGDADTVFSSVAVIDAEVGSDDERAAHDAAALLVAEGSADAQGGACFCTPSVVPAERRCVGCTIAERDSEVGSIPHGEAVAELEASLLLCFQFQVCLVSLGVRGIGAACTFTETIGCAVVGTEGCPCPRLYGAPHGIAIASPGVRAFLCIVGELPHFNRGDAGCELPIGFCRGEVSIGADGEGFEDAME